MLVYRSCNMICGGIGLMVDMNIEKEWRIQDFQLGVLMFWPMFVSTSMLAAATPPITERIPLFFRLDSGTTLWPLIWDHGCFPIAHVGVKSVLSQMSASLTPWQPSFNLFTQETKPFFKIHDLVLVSKNKSTFLYLDWPWQNLLAKSWLISYCKNRWPFGG